MSAPAVAARPVGTAPLRRSPLRTILLVAASVVALVIVAIALYAVTRTPERPLSYLSATSGGPDGARAVVNVLRDQGVDVHTVSTLADLEALHLDPTETTIAMYDASLVLGESGHDRVLDAAHHIVVFDPWDTELADLAPGVALVSSYPTSGTFPADCDVAAVQKAEELSSAAYLYDTAEAESDTTDCYQDEDGSGFVEVSTRGTDVSLVGVSAAITNGNVLEAGNAAFALNLLGADPHLVWYTPSLSELDSGGGGAGASVLNPGWVTPLVLLLGAGVLMAAVWRGRRLGPLVAERLPVIVRANETMTGRARLYERARDRTHALDALRIGTVDRLATACGLPRRATVDEVVDAVAALTGRPRDAVRTLLVEVEPTNDAALVRFSDDLLRLEADTLRAARAR